MYQGWTNSYVSQSHSATIFARCGGSCRSRSGAEETRLWDHSQSDYEPLHQHQTKLSSLLVSFCGARPRLDNKPLYVMLEAARSVVRLRATHPH